MHTSQICNFSVHALPFSDILDILLYASVPNLVAIEYPDISV